MSFTASKMRMAAASGSSLDVAEVFSTTLYAGTGSQRSVSTGIDLLNNGGAGFFKVRDVAGQSQVYDTERGFSLGRGLRLSTSEVDAEQATADFEAFTSNGFNIAGAATAFNNLSHNYVVWSFRKAPKFFDVVTWTGDGVAGKEIPHSLGGVPGMIMVKKASNVGDWGTYHRELSASQAIYLNYTSPAGTLLDQWDNTEPTGTDFTIGDNSQVNAIGETYVAYLFAHDPEPTGIIQCGSYEATSSSGLQIDLGWEPQYVLIKPADGAQSWHIFDSARGGDYVGNPDPLLFANTSGAENSVSGRDHIEFNSTGFELMSFTSDINNSANGTHIYMAIRAEGV